MHKTGQCHIAIDKKNTKAKKKFFTVTIFLHDVNRKNVESLSQDSSNPLSNRKAKSSQRSSDEYLLHHIPAS